MKSLTVRHSLMVTGDHTCTYHLEVSNNPRPPFGMCACPDAMRLSRAENTIGERLRGERFPIPSAREVGTERDEG